MFRYKGDYVVIRAKFSSFVVGNQQIISRIEKLKKQHKHICIQLKKSRKSFPGGWGKGRIELFFIISL